MSQSPRRLAITVALSLALLLLSAAAFTSRPALRYSSPMKLISRKFLSKESEGNEQTKGHIPEDFLEPLISEPENDAQTARVADRASTIDTSLRPKQQIQTSTRLSQEPSDSPDRALSIVSELKSNAALFAAFAYGGLSLPSLLTVTESKVTSVTTSLSTARPLPGNDLIQAFLVLDTVTLCLMISCVAACQLLIYRLTDGSWYEDQEGRDPRVDQTTPTTVPTLQSASAMGRLVTDYKLEFTVARTTFDLGLVAMLLAVAVRSVAMFETSISRPIIMLLGGTCLLLAVAYLQSYLQVFRRLEQPLQKKNAVVVTSKSRNTSMLIPSAAVVAIAAVLYVTEQRDANLESTNRLPKEQSSIIRNLGGRLASYSSAAGDNKLKLAVDTIAVKKAARKESAQLSKKEKASGKINETVKKAAVETKDDKGGSSDSDKTSRRAEQASGGVVTKEKMGVSSAPDNPGPSKQASPNLVLESDDKIGEK